MKKTVFVLHVIALLTLAAGCAAPRVRERAETAPAAGFPFMGISYKSFELTRKHAHIPGARAGVRISRVIPGGPASKAGFLQGDVIIGMDGNIFTSDPDNVKEEFLDALALHEPGDEMDVTVVRPGPDGKRPGVVVIEMTLGRKYGVRLPPLPDVMASDLGRALSVYKENSRILSREAMERLIERHGMAEEYNDLGKRLKKIESASDGTRLPAVAAVHRDPFLLEPLGRYFTDNMIDGKDRLMDNLFMDPEISLFFSARRREPGRVEFRTISAGSDAGEFRAWFTDCLRIMTDSLKEAYEPLSDEERDFLKSHWAALTDLYIHPVSAGEDYGKFEKDARVVELGRKIDIPRLFHAAGVISGFMVQAGPMVFEWMEAHPDVRVIKTPWGKLGLGSKQYDRWDDPNVKFIFDPGGDDFYAYGAAASSFNHPVSWVIDLGGDDAYQATSSPGQGSGVFGVGVLWDRGGDDVYIGGRWTQGAGFMGVGILVDERGADAYTAVEFSQGAAMFGYGAAADGEGDDVWRAALYSQGVGLSLGIGMLIDYAGDDRGFCSGQKPSSYGTPGVFEGWSQGCGAGPRGLASGGVGVLIDAGGDDRWEAGTFSQGGGYYYGLGIFRSAGQGSDRYIGSRYAQGFSAHQAAGIFMEDGGDDHYTTRNGVVSGLAWDQSVSVFIDEGGDDYYFGGMGFSLGASAHNSFCLFTDMGGRDEYHHARPGETAGNDYHGGSSFSFFNDLGRELDLYTDKKVKNNVELLRPGFSIFRDGGALGID